MEKIRNLVEFQDALDTELGWRIKEVVDLKAAANSRRVFVRAGIALIYAHWEGFIKAASVAYLNLVENQNHTVRELKNCFLVFGLKSHLHLLGASRQAKRNVESLEFIIDKLDDQAKLTLSTAIDTESNLSSAVFSNIASSLDIDTTRYLTRYNLIDESLIKRRNKVAHGEYIDLDPSQFRTLADEVVQLMRDYKTDVENAASLFAYRRASQESALIKDLKADRR